MAKSKVSAVVFDVGGVLVDWSPEYLYRNLIADEQERDFFLNNVCTFEWHEQADAGRNFGDMIAEKKAEFPGKYDELIDAWWAQWDKMFGGIKEDTFAVVAKLRQECPDIRIYGLTNYSAEAWPKLAKLYPQFDGLFDGVLVSGVEKVKKPSLAVYELLIERFSLVPDETIFIDDRYENLEAAAQAGIRGLLFTDGSTLDADLTKTGIF